MAKTRSLFFCSSCGHESTRWLGRCPACEAWNSFAEAPRETPSRTRGEQTANGIITSAPLRLSEVESDDLRRISTGFEEFDLLLGGGVVPGSLVLIGGAPGAGKSTLLLQIASALTRNAGPTVYVCGEESAAQTKMRAQRLGIGDDILLFAETNLRAILDTLKTLNPRALIIDSIQTMVLPEVESSAGSVAQVREGAAALMEFAKRSGCATFIVGHVTKDGAIAGPRLLEHLVDTVLYFEGESGTAEYRILRAYKNRFGSAEEICVFSMHENGLREIRNPSQLFLGRAGERASRLSGSCVIASIVGSRPVLAEIQALVGETSYGTPRRLAANLDPARLAIVIAVLERRAGMALGAHDVYVSVAGGLRITEPAADLGMALAIASAFRNRPLEPGTAAFGELGLSGELRAVTQSARRVAEAKRLGFETLHTPTSARDVGAALRAALG